MDSINLQPRDAHDQDGWDGERQPTLRARQRCEHEQIPELRLFLTWAAGRWILMR